MGKVVESLIWLIVVILLYMLKLVALLFPAMLVTIFDFPLTYLWLFIVSVPLFAVINAFQDQVTKVITRRLGT